MPPRIAFSTLACPNWSWGRILERASAYGFDGVEVRLLEDETDLLRRPEFAPDVIGRRSDELEQHGLKVCGLASSVRFDDADSLARARQHEIGVGYLELAARLGAAFVRVFGDVLPPHERPADREQALARIAEGLDRLGRVSESMPEPVGVLIETHGDFSDSRLMAELMSRIKSPQVGVLWDTHHPWRFHGEPLGETWSRLGRWVRHTHWKDSSTISRRVESAEAVAADRQARALMAGHRAADYVLFGEGDFPAAQCARVLVAGGYSGWYSYEWEKAWHPEIEDPEAALPPFPERMRVLVR